MYLTLTVEKIEAGLNKLGLYIFDYDLTTDIKGCIDKQKFIEYLIDKHGFTLGEGQTDKHIIENDHTVSNTCLSFWVRKQNGIFKS